MKISLRNAFNALLQLDHHFPVILLHILQLCVGPSIVFASAASYLSPVSIKCPPERVLYPCKCHHNERILCTEAMTYSISHIFKAISYSMASAGPNHLAPFNVGPLYKEFVLSNKLIAELDKNIFHSVRFKKISLLNVDSLERIKQRAFNGTTEDVETFVIKGENRLGINFVNEFFDALSTLVNVREMHLELHHLRVIQSVAFRNMTTDGKLRLQKLRIISRSLAQISSYAFYQLHSLQSIKVHSTESGLQRISAHAFDIAQPSTHPLTIDLRYNQLTVSSFELDAFGQVGRPVHLQLSYNNLTSLPRNIFERFLVVHSGNKMQLAENPLECHCEMSWLLKDGQIYMNQVLSAFCDGYAELWRLDDTAYRRECDINGDYYPRLIFRNGEIQLFSRHLLLLPVILQFIL